MAALQGAGQPVQFSAVPTGYRVQSTQMAVRRYPNEIYSNLSMSLHAATSVGVSTATTLAMRPISNGLRDFFFLFRAPNYVTPRRKAELSREAAKRFKAWGGPSMAGEACWGAAVLTTYAAIPHASESLYPCNGFMNGAVCGAILAAVRHPIDVLRATSTAPGPKKFSGAWDVFMTSLRHKPQVLFGIYKGFPVSLLATSLEFSMLFGFWEMFKRRAMQMNDVPLYLVAFVGAYMAEAARYPVRWFHNKVVQENAKRKFGSLSYVAVLTEMRRMHGVSMWWTGFMKAQPFIQALRWSVLIATYDVVIRGMLEERFPGIHEKHHDYS